MNAAELYLKLEGMPQTKSKSRKTLHNMVGAAKPMVKVTLPNARTLPTAIPRTYISVAELPKREKAQSLPQTAASRRDRKVHNSNIEFFLIPVICSDEQ
jgi:hypothetical protein